MKKIDEARLESDLAYRFDYLAEFVGFTADDVAALRESAPLLGPRIPSIVERTYAKLLAYDATARHFVPRQHGHVGPVPASLEALSTEHEQIRFRKDHLSRYFLQLIGRPHGAALAGYLDMVGKMHTPKAGNPEITVPLVQMNAFLGMLSDILTETVLGLGLEAGRTGRLLRAFGKLLWIQNDLVSRHYAASCADGERVSSGTPDRHAAPGPRSSVR